MTAPVTFKLAGVSHRPGYPRNLQRLHEVQYADGRDGEGIGGVLVREADNKFDPNAVAVHCPALGDEAHIGYVPKGANGMLAQRLDAGDRAVAEVQVRLHPDHPDKPGADVIVTLHPPTGDVPSAEVISPDGVEMPDGYDAPLTPAEEELRSRSMYGGS